MAIDATDLDFDESAELGCGHPACACAAGESGYCSPHCEAAGDVEIGDDAGEDEMSCGCGHAACESAAAAREV